MFAGLANFRQWWYVPGMETGNAVVVKKAYEIAYAAFRLSQNLPQQNSFQNELESQALGLLSASLAAGKEQIQGRITALSYLLRFGADVGFISRNNAELMLAELGNLNSATAELGKAKTLPDIELGKIFTPIESGKPAKGNPAKQNKANGEQSDNAAAKDREKVILEKVGQLGNCRLKDILAALPGLSERTLRYDLQSLVSGGILERIGAGGPGTFYRLKNQAESQVLAVSEPVSSAQNGTA